MTVSDVIAALGNQVALALGSLDRVVARPAPLNDADGDAIAFCRTTGDEGRKAIAASGAGTIICTNVDRLEELADEKTLIVVGEPRLAFLRVLEQFFRTPRPRGVHPTAVVEGDARVAPDASVGAFSYIGQGVEIGSASVIHPNVTIYSGTTIGQNVVVWSGTVIGLDGFGFHRNESGELERFGHVGGVKIEDDVELGANSIVARGALGNTVIRRGAKIDCFVHVAHNVVIGEAAIVIAHAMLGGSVQIGARAWLAPCACVRDGVEVGEDATVGMGAVVVKDVPAGATVMGAPARDATEFRKMLDGLKRLSSQTPLL